jgi:hypothetical protein
MLSRASVNLSAVPIGPQIVLTGDFTSSDGDGEADIYNPTSGTLNVVPLVENDSNLIGAPLNSKAIFVGSEAENPFENAEIYDSATGAFTLAPLVSPFVATNSPAALASSNATIFFGDSAADPSQAVADIFTDLTLAGSIAAATNGTINVTLQNQSQSLMPAPSTVILYASPTDSLGSDAILIGKVKLKRIVPAGQSQAFPFSVPATLPAGDYHLIAVGGPADDQITFAATKHTFALGAPAAARRAGVASVAAPNAAVARAAAANAVPATAANAPAPVAASPFFSPLTSTALDFGDTLAGG